MAAPANLKNLPKHIAIIMDGNGRWANRRGLPRLAGHRRGADTAKQIVNILLDYEIPYVTLYAFSTENWNRPRGEIDSLFRILEERLDEEVRFAREKQIKVRHLGKPDGLPSRVLDRVKQVLELTQNGSRMTLNLAFNYGGRGEIVEAVRRLVLDGIPAKEINEAVFSQYLYTAGIPDPDLIIRTGGEMRLSNFLPWQSAYTEIYFTPVLWPDFDKKELDRALFAYSQRQRRFGGLAPKQDTSSMSPSS